MNHPVDQIGAILIVFALLALAFSAYKTSTTDLGSPEKDGTSVVRPSIPDNAPHCSHDDESANAIGVLIVVVLIIVALLFRKKE